MENPFSPGGQGEKKRSRRALLTTETELSAMAPPGVTHHGHCLFLKKEPTTCGQL
ncbi:MAG: hypothetical protein AB1461_15040 [Thermodesulfobacteriota bacterium]